MNRQIKVGLFVALGLLVAGILVFLVGDERHMFDRKAQLHATFRDVAGLKVGSPVRMGGVDVGHVENDTELQSIFFHFITELTLSLNRRFYLGLKEHEFHLAFYPPGSFYKKHRDAFKSDDARKITVLLYLNQNWKSEDGGELILYKDDNSSLTIEPLGGRLLVFESEMEHEVLISNTNRYSLTGWIKNKSRLI